MMYNKSLFLRVLNPMPQVSRSALVDFSAQQMFDLVNDIARYPEYMPGCIAAEVLSSSAECVEARLTLGKSGISQSFVTRNILVAGESMVMELVEGPFKHFKGDWQFTPLAEQACKVSLELSFEFNNPLLAMTMNKKLEEMAGRQVDAISERAKQTYGGDQ